MKTETILCLSLLLLTCLSVSQVKPSAVTCTCSQIQYQTDCLATTTTVNSKSIPCQWTTNTKATASQAKGVCATPSSTSITQATAASTYCSQIAISTCPLTNGCATTDGKTCTPFTGCSAYIYNSDILCQAVSNQCTTDGIPCTPKAACSTYSLALCTNSSSSGSGKCKIINKTCVDQVCSDVVQQSVCAAFSGCIWNGSTCATTLSSCAQTPGTLTICPSLIGSDGPCKYISGANCTGITCADAQSTISTNASCIAFLPTCLFTTGKGCTAQLLNCSSYLQINTCSGYIGSDGPCMADATSTTACRALQCSEAPTTLNTDAGCGSFRNGCVTTGSGCTSIKGPCSGYNGTTTTCANYIGSDGNCKGTSTTSATCAVRVCTDNISATINNACKQFQSGCVSNGRGCTLPLPLCSTYTIATNSPCDGLIGSDGNCTSGSGATCVARTCSSATADTTTNTGCQAYSPICVSNGTTCVPQSGTCESQPTLLQCQADTTCSQSSACPDNTICDNYKTQALCALNKAGPQDYKRPCTWSSTRCIDTQCTSFTGNNYMNNAACNSALFGCVFSGINSGGCIEPTAGCSAFYGTNSSSSLCATAMKGTCWGTSSTIGQCATRACNFYSGITSTTDLICQTFLKGCVSDGAMACITPGACELYFGSDTSCKQITTNTNLGIMSKHLCWPISNGQSSGACKTMACSDIIIGISTFTAVTSSACSSINPNCTTSFNSGSGSQCIAFGPCSSYNFSVANCKNALTNLSGVTCTKQQQCSFTDIQPACTSYLVPSSDTTTNQIYCQTKYTGTNLCAFISGNSCVAQTTISSCTGFAIPSTITTQQNKFNYCQKMNIGVSNQCGYSSGNTCVAVNCSQQTPTITTDCISILGTNCAYQFNVTASCTLYQANCAYAIPNTITQLSAKLKWCNSIRDSYATNGCGYSSGGQCTYKACPDVNGSSYEGTITQGVCLNYKTNCQYVEVANSCIYQDSCVWIEIPTYVSDTSIQLAFLFCGTILSSSSKKYCTFEQSQKYCQTNQRCTSFLVAGPGDYNVLANQDYCSQLHDASTSGNYACTYDGTGSSTHCSAPGYGGSTGCTTYVVIGSSGNDMANQIYCSRLIELDGGTPRPCGYRSGANSCNSLTGIECLDNSYTPLLAVDTEAFRMAICQAYSVRCGYVMTGTVNTSSKCVTRSCSDVGLGFTSNIECQNYISTCRFNKFTNRCYNMIAGCALANSNNLENCSAMIDSTNLSLMCGYKVGNSQCKSRECSDISNATKNSDCSGYLSTCIYDGTKCQVQRSTCASYIYTANSATAKDYCQTLTTYNGIECTNDPSSGSTTCIDKSSIKGCQNAPLPVNTLDCIQWSRQCIADASGPCANQVCTENTTTTANSQCPAQCIWNGTTGCVLPTVTCSTFLGIDSTCRQFIGNSIQCYQSNTSATATTPCSELKACTQNTTATTDQLCEIFWPSPKSKPVNTTCQWNGSTGCVAGNSMTCSQYTGTIDTCPKFIGATNAPCKGTSINSTACAPTVCTDAPNTATTDDACNTFRIGCIPTGSGCQSPPVSTGNSACQIYQNQTTCNASKLGGTGSFNTCIWASSCIAAPTSCNAASQYACITTLVSKTLQYPLGTCSWYINSGTGACRQTSCADLSLSNTTDVSCSALMSTCTTNGAGCVTKGACSTYLTNLTCTSAATTDSITKCFWTGSGCRMQQCQDNNFTTNEACNTNGLKTCRSTGTTCIEAINLTCNNFMSASICIKDGNNSPCLWINGACQSYLGCTSVPLKTHAQCQLILTGATTPQCTSDGVQCQPLNSCSNYKSITTSCVIANDGSTCGMLPAGSNQNTIDQCQKFGSCTDAKGTNNSICQAYGQSCISNGTNCQSISTCASYSQIVCTNLGTDGTCYWSTKENLCRTQKCSDAIINNTSDLGCASFPAPYINTCTTNGTICINRSTCASYTLLASCVLGTDGDCFWVAAVASASTGTCRVKQCSDVISATTFGCQNQIVTSPASTSIKGTIEAKYIACVSNGKNCINKANCADYTNSASCSGSNYGLDGTCAFTPTNSTSPSIGTCKLVQQCSDAGVDQSVCSIYSDRCQFKSLTSGNATTSSCISQDCISKSGGSMCQPILSWDGTTYTLCLPVSATNTTCQIGDGSAFTSSTCFIGSVKTYTWNDTLGACTYCGTSQTVNNTNNTNQTSATNYGVIIKSTFLVFGALIANY